MKTHSFSKIFKKKCEITERIFIFVITMSLLFLSFKVFFYEELSLQIFLTYISMLVIFLALSFLAYYDFVKMVVHNKISFMLMIGLLGINLVLFFLTKIDNGITLTDNFQYIPYDNFIAALILGSIFTSIVLISREKALGQGDIRIAIIIGLIVGYGNLIPWVYITILTALLYGFLLGIKVGKFQGLKIPFVPFMVLGCVLVLLWNI